MISRLLFYVGYALAWALGITAVGTALGALAFPIVGTLAGSDASIGAMAAAGAKNIGFLAFIWGPGVGIVMAFHRAYCKAGKKTEFVDPP